MGGGFSSPQMWLSTPAQRSNSHALISSLGIIFIFLGLLANLKNENCTVEV